VIWRIVYGRDAARPRRCLHSLPASWWLSRAVSTLSPCPRAASWSWTEISAFRVVVDNVITAIRKLPDKRCANDSFPMRLLKDNVDVLIPFVRTAFVTQLLKMKKADLDHSQETQYIGPYPTSVLSKSLERFVVRHLVAWTTISILRTVHHFAETSVRSKRHLSSVGSWWFGCSDATWLVDGILHRRSHDALLTSENFFNTDGIVRSWFSSYLQVTTTTTTTTVYRLQFHSLSARVPQGSIGIQGRYRKGPLLQRSAHAEQYAQTKTNINPNPDPNRYRRRCPDPNARIQKLIHCCYCYCYCYWCLTSLNIAQMISDIATD